MKTIRGSYFPLPNWAGVFTPRKIEMLEQNAMTKAQIIAKRELGYYLSHLDMFSVMASPSFRHHDDTTIRMKVLALRYQGAALERCKTEFNFKFKKDADGDRPIEYKNLLQTYKPNPCYTFDLKTEEVVFYDIDDEINLEEKERIPISEVRFENRNPNVT